MTTSNQWGYPMLADLKILGDLSHWRESLPDPATLSAIAVANLLDDLHRLEASFSEAKLAAVAQFTDQRTEDYHKIGVMTSDAVELVESEIGVAITVSRTQAGGLIGLAMSLRDRLPRVREALKLGQLDTYRARQIDSATANIGEDLIDTVEKESLKKILAGPGNKHHGLTGKRLTNAVGRVINKLDPDGVRERRERKRDGRYVGISPEDNGSVFLNGSLPAEDGRKLDSRLRELAGTVCRKDGRTFDQRKADGLMALVDGQSALRCLCGNPDCAHTGMPLATARKPLVHLIMLGSTLAGEDEEPGYLDGHGLVDADHARNIAKDADLAPVQLPDDVTAERASPRSSPPESALRYRPSAALDTWVRILGGMCQWPHCDAPAWNCDLDHTTPFDHENPGEGGPTTSGGLTPYCRNHHRIKHSGLWDESRDDNGDIILASPIGLLYRTPAAGLLSVLGITPDEVVDPKKSQNTAKSQRRRRTRQEDKAAKVRAERNRQHTRRLRENAERTRARAARQRERIAENWEKFGWSPDDPPPF
ncbi:HNH endonuclease signature motif containing protein [Tomitella biformata]|uniref:HNH endonuclease signature motif containing protein n=1 Tax=Tomitella biformata TaxID=630403 RepID=UPI0004BA141B|nr:HNH endonuclease signature motif containing protein [Tomitella biformata]